LHGFWLLQGLRAIAAVTQDLRAGQTVRDPVCAARSAGGEHFSVTTKRTRLDCACPPNSRGQVMPMNPAAPARLLNAASKLIQEDRCDT
jgi:hypothetical protein